MCGQARTLCVFVFLMRSERASRVCIVVLEEVEEDEPSPPPHPNTSLDHRSHHAPRRPPTQEDKVRYTLEPPFSVWFRIRSAKISQWFALAVACVAYG